MKPRKFISTKIFTQIIFKAKISGSTVLGTMHAPYKWYMSNSEVRLSLHV